MLTLAYMVNDISQLEDISCVSRNEGRNDAYISRDHKVRAEVYEQIKHIPVERIYYGTEFCEFLIPKLENLKSMIEEVKKKGYELTLLTPIVTDYGIEKLEILFEYLVSNYTGNEIVFNDWGVFNLLRTKYPNLKLVAGRAIDKMTREPRLYKEEYNEYYSEVGMEYMKSSSMFTKVYQQYLKDSGVNRAELDFVPQGLLEPEAERKVSVSVYIPYYYVTTGRHCMMRMLKRPDNEKFVLDSTCSLMCEKYDIFMNKYGEKLDKENEHSNVKLYRKGNTVYGLNMKINELLNHNFYDRLIFQIGI